MATEGQKYKVVKVTVERTYLVPLYGDGGTTVEQLCHEWFQRYPADQHHASRDAHRAGEKFLRVEIQQGEVG